MHPIQLFVSGNSTRLLTKYEGYNDDGLTELGGGGEELLGQGEGLARHQRLVLVLQAAQLELGAGQRALKKLP